MADDRAYRILLKYVRESESFVAEVPELELRAEAEGRADALARVEALLDGAFEKAAVEGRRLPPPAELEAEGAQLPLALSAPVWRDLQFHARAQGLEPGALALQLLARALGQLEGRGYRRPPAEAPAAPAAEARPPEQPKGESGRRRNRGRGAGGRREGYRPEMEDQANFLAYVRDQERGGGGGGRGRR